MADLMSTMDTRARDDAYGSDVAADIDRGTGLPADTAATVIRELAARGRRRKRLMRLAAFDNEYGFR